MADTPVQVTEAAPVAATAPVTATVVEAVQNATTTPPVAAAAAAVESAPVTTTTTTETAPTVTETVTAPKAETVLGEALDATTKPAEVKPAAAEVKPVEGEKKIEEGGQSEETAPPPVYDAFSVPEGVSLDAERVKEFTSILSELESKGKVTDHAMMQEFGQKAVDFHINELKRYAEDVNKLYVSTWERQKVQWKDDFLADPDIGGNRFQTTVDAARTFIATHGGTPEQQTELRNLLESSGLGNHKAVIRLFAQAGGKMSEGKPLAAPKPVPQVKSKTETLYGKGK